MKNKEFICCFGEVLWDDFPSGRLPGGAPMNVAIGLQSLGIPSVMISRVGCDNLGQEIKHFLAAKNCSTTWIQTDSEHRTGIVKVKASLSGENTYDIVQPIAWDFIEPSPQLKNIISKSYALVFGTLACRQQNNLHTLLYLLSAASLKVFDVNFRPPFYDKNLVALLLEQADIVKMNDEELAIIAAWYALSENTEQQKMEFIYNKFHLYKLVVTKGANGAVCYDENGLHTVKGFKVVVQDTVGSGDAFLAGFLKMLYEGASTANALQYACALGALVASHKGANPDIKENDIQKLMNENFSALTII